MGWKDFHTNAIENNTKWLEKGFEYLQEGERKTGTWSSALCPLLTCYNFPKLFSVEKDSHSQLIQQENQSHQWRTMEYDSVWMEPILSVQNSKLLMLNLKDAWDDRVYPSPNLSNTTPHNQNNKHPHMGELKLIYMCIFWPLKF